MTRMTLRFGEYAFPVWLDASLPQGPIGFVQRRGDIIELLPVQPTEDGVYIAPLQLAIPEPVAVLAEA